MTDLISRQAAIDALSMMQGIVAENGVRKGISLAWQQIKDLPSAHPLDPCETCLHKGKGWDEDPCDGCTGTESKYEPDVKKGKWIVMETAYEDTEAKCSKCDFTTLVNEPGNGLHMLSDLNYCPNCGADMRGGEE